PSAPRALAAVCQKAMMRDPAGRYASADELATEVRRWLADEPVEAFREPFAARAARWARRRKTAVVGAAVVLLTLAGASSAAAGPGWLGGEEQKTAAAKDRADRNSRLARGVSADALGLIQHVEPVLASTSELHALRKGVLTAGTEAFREHLAESPDDPSIRSQ